MTITTPSGGQSGQPQPTSTENKQRNDSNSSNNSSNNSSISKPVKSIEIIGWGLMMSRGCAELKIHLKIDATFATLTHIDR